MARQQSSGLTHEVRRVAGYVRVSTAYQKVSGLGLEAQRQKIEAMATVKGWPTPRIFADEGISGAKETADREQLRLLMEAIQAGEVDAVIVSSLDRLGRNARLLLVLAEEMQHYGVSLISCKESIDSATPSGKLVLTVLAAIAEFERQLAKERTVAALEVNDQRKGERGGRILFGYHRTGNGLVIVEHQAAVIRTIFAQRKRSKSLREIASMLNDGGYTLPRSGVRWWASQVHDILSNRDIYRGGKRNASDVRWPAILK